MKANYFSLGGKLVNQDYAIISPEKGVYIIADGVTRSERGEEASRLAANTIFDEFSCKVKDIKESLIQAFEKANENVFALSHEARTTLDVAVVRDNRCYVGHMGDSRVYKINKDGIVQITKDNKDDGGRLTKCLGRQNTVEPDIEVFDLKEGDYLLLCTDGIHEVVEESDIKDIVLSEYKLLVKRQMLIDAVKDILKDDASIVLYHHVQDYAQSLYLLNPAQKLYKEGRLDEAAKLLKRIIKDNEDENEMLVSDACILLGKVFQDKQAQVGAEQKSQMLVAVEQALNYAISYNPMNGKAHYELAIHLAGKGEDEKAKTELLHAVSCDYKTKNVVENLEKLS